MITKKTTKLKISARKNDSHPRDQANFLSHCLFYWQLRTLLRIWRKKVREEEFTTPVAKHEAENLGGRLEKFWDEQRRTKKPSLYRALFRLFGLEAVMWGLIFFTFDTIATFAQPVYLGKLFDYFLQTEPIQTKDACIYAVVIILSGYVRVLNLQIFTVEIYDIGLRVRTACCSLIYRKILTSKTSTLHTHSLAQILNIVSNDVEKFENICYYLHRLWIGILKLCGSLYFFYVWSGFQGIAGAGILVLFLLVQYFFFKQATSCQKRVITARDDRIKIMNDIIFKIKAIKLHAWEARFDAVANTKRRSELNHITKLNNILNVNYTFVSYIHKISVYIIVVLMTTTGSSINPKSIYMCMNLYNVLKYSLDFSVAAINLISDLRVSVTRIEAFLLCEEESVTVEEAPNLRRCKVLANNVTAKWSLSSQETLNHINFELKSGELVAIVGAAGSGKSSLLQLILKELPVIKGTLWTTESISYASQSPWVFPATLRENIIFGETFDQNKYTRVLRVCALEHDISLFPHGDKTLVGERGVMLSGGQKARLNLARAVYKDADVYLLDDPLAAVDIGVAHHIFTECILDYLKQKSVLFVTHQTTFLDKVDKVCVLEHGQVKYCGKYQKAEAERQEQDFQRNLELSEEALLERYSVQSEVKEDTNDSSSSNYKTYFSSCKHRSLIYIQVFLFVVTQVFINGPDVFVSFWINLKQHVTSFKPTIVHFFTDTNCTYLYSGFVLMMLIVSQLSNILFVRCCKQISKQLHDTIFAKILRGTMKFFNDHSSGRIVNRMSSDISTIDEAIPRSMYQTIRLASTQLGSLVVVTLLNFYMAIPTFFLILLFYCCFILFRPVLSKLRKIATTRKSPIFTNIATSVEGLATIKALKAQKFFLQKLHTYQNEYNSVAYLHITLQCFYCFCTDLICSVYSTVVMFYLILFRRDEHIGNVGLSIVEALLLVGHHGAIRIFGDLDAQMISVGRVADYHDLKTEDDEATVKPPTSWPCEGKISFRSLSMRYSPEKPYVLNNINLEIHAGEKIGIVGRTGAGKSSFISTLFRLYDFEGTILIDNVDIKLIPLSILRSKVAIIPQEPVLFSGTIRNNLDPFREFADSQLWTALEEVKLKELISGLSSGLDSPVLEDGANFSVGQRQLMCLVRAMLKKASIVVLDEATAFIDLETDKLIQTTFRERFEKSTVLKIAHRLDTVLDSDRILVIDEGCVVEFGRTNALLKNKNSWFYKYVNKRC